MKRNLIVALMILPVLALAAGVAYATIPDGQSVIHGCYSKSGGALASSTAR